MEKKTIVKLIFYTSSSKVEDLFTSSLYNSIYIEFLCVLIFHSQFCFPNEFFFSQLKIILIFNFNSGIFSEYFKTFCINALVIRMLVANCGILFHGNVFTRFFPPLHFFRNVRQRFCIKSYSLSHLFYSHVHRTNAN